VIATYRRLLGRLSTACALGAAALIALPGAAAHASVLNLNDCNTSALSQPFAPWADSAWYELAPAGDFESTGWTLSGGASVVSGSEPFAATGTLGSSSLSLPAGSLLVGGTGSVAVSVIYQGVSIPTGVAVSAGSWTPTAPMATFSAVWGLLSGGTANVSIQLTALTGSPLVDDVFVDPMGGH
jgi:hypothetical protein